MQWKIDDTPVEYPTALSAMERRVADICDGVADEQVWLLEHPALYTAGTSANEADLLDARFPVYTAGRGGQYTYHGPGQRIGYVMLDLKKRKPDLRRFVCDLEQWLIATLDEFNIKGERREGRVGIWVDMSRYGKPAGTEAKIAAIGVRVRKWVTFHGVSLNVDPDLSHFNGIVPCGISQHGVTSFFDLGHAVSMAEVDAAMQHSWDKVFEKAA